MKRKIIIATVAAAALVGGGSATAFGVAGSSGGDGDRTLPRSQAGVQLSNADHDSDDRDDNTAADRDEDTGNSDVSLREASAAALKAVPGKITELELDTEGNRLVWEADVLGKDSKSHKVELDANSGKLLTQRIDQDDDDAAENSAAKSARTDAVAAASKAAANTGGTVTSVSLEDDVRSGSPVWEVETVGKNGTEHEVSIDSGSGKVTQQSTDDDSDDDHGDDDDHDELDD